MPGIASIPVIASNTWWAKTIHDTSSSRGPIAAISQSSTATGSEVAVHHVADPRVAPAQDRLVGLGDVALEPRQRPLDRRERPMSATAKSYQARVRARLRSRSVPPAWGGARNPKVSSASGMPCSFASTVTLFVPQPALVLGCSVVQPVVASCRAARPAAPGRRHGP